MLPPLRLSVRRFDQRTGLAVSFDQRKRMVEPLPLLRLNVQR
jgi:hypothetical protein